MLAIALVQGTLGTENSTFFQPQPYLFVVFLETETFFTNTFQLALDNINSSRLSRLVLPAMFQLCSFSAACLIISSVSADATCPTWHYYDNDTQLCQCGSNLYCVGEELVEIKESHCATYAGYRDYYYTGLCPFIHTVNNTNRLFSEMPSDPDMLDDVMCGHFHRKGLLCGKCSEGFGPAIHSLDLKCADCSKPYSGIIFYVLLELTPITVVFICIVLTRFNITSGPLLGYVFACQVLTFYCEMTQMIKYAAYHHTLP